MPERHGKPLPAADDLSQPFWEAARQRRLVVQRCQDCGYFNHPPRPACDACQSQQLQFEPVSGRGTIYSFTVMHQPNVAGFEDEVPYLNILVELEEQPLLFMVSNLAFSKLDKIQIGRTVELYFEEVDDDVTLPKFRPI